MGTAFYTANMSTVGDDFFLVLRGRVKIRMREGDVTLGPGQFYVVPCGVEHGSVAEDGAEVMLIERQGRRTPGMRRRQQ